MISGFKININDAILCYMPTLKLNFTNHLTILSTHKFIIKFLIFGRQIGI